MNPLTNVKNINKLNEIELAKGLVDKKSWHDVYKESAWIFIGGLAYGLTEGDILSVFSQYGEIVNLNLVRDTKTGKIKGFCFLCYANQKSTVLAVDNLNGIKLCGRTIRVDHVQNYKPPKEHENDDEITKQIKAEGCAPKPIKLEDSSNAPEVKQEKKKSKKVKKEKKKHKKKRKHEDDEGRSHKKVKVKEEKHDPGYSKYEFPEKEKVSERNYRDLRKDSTDSESSSSDSPDTDSNHQLSRNRMIKHKHNVKRSEENCDSRGRLKSRKSDGRDTNKSDDSNSASSRSKLYETSDHVKSKNKSDSECHEDSFTSYNNVRSRYSSESKKVSSKHHTRDSPSDRESEISYKQKLNDAEKIKENHKRCESEEYVENNSRSHKRRESSQHQVDSDFERESHLRKNYQYDRATDSHIKVYKHDKTSSHKQKHVEYRTNRHKQKEK